MKNMISDKKTVPVPERGKKNHRAKTLRGKKAIVTSVCIMLAAVSSCIVGVTAAPVEVEGLALQEKVTPVKLKEAAEEVLKKASPEDALKGEADKDVLKEANAKDAQKKAADSNDVGKKEETVAPKTENAGIEAAMLEHEPQHEDEQQEISSQQARQQEAGNDFAIEDDQKRIIEETAEENEAVENKASGKAGILKSAESAEEAEVVGKGQAAREEKDAHKKPERQDAVAGENDKNNDAAEDDNENNDGAEDDGENKGDAGVNDEGNTDANDETQANDEIDADDETQANDDLLQTPVEGFIVSSPFGPRWGRFHTGIDLALAQGHPIYAAAGGTVIFSGYSGGYGNMVKIDHGNGMQTNYAHCSQLLVTQGQQVERGEEIALVGSTGNSTGPHLHFEVVIDGSCVDPASYLELE